MANGREEFCGMLRTKMAYFRAPDGRRLINPASSTACYICMRTLKPYGPDGIPADALQCGPGRVCFEEEK